MSILGVNAIVLLALMTALWLVSVRLRNVSIVDIAWGPSFAILAWIAAASESATSHLPERILPLLTTVWGVRLGVHLAARNLGRDEDRRYAAFRRKAGTQFWWKSLFTVFWLQAALIWGVGLPLQWPSGDPPPGSRFLLTAGLCLWGMGLLFESIADWQLVQFQGNSANRGQVLDRGLWRYTRHPNYFGDCCVWWGLFLCAAGRGTPVWTAVGPAIMTILLVRISGVRLLEEDLLRSKPGYADYVRRTSSFLPLPPKRSASAVD